jgi:cell division protein FtsQ
VIRRFVLLVILAVAVLVAAVWFLRIDEVRVVGARSLSTRAIIEASGLEPGERILWERLTVAERRIEDMPAVADAVAERSLPSTVILRVFEREPIARLEGARHLVVDANGVIFPGGQRDVRRVLYGWKGKARMGSRVDAASRLVLEEYSAFPERLLMYGRRLRVGRRFTLTLLGGTEIRFGVLRDLGAKATVADAILVAERGKKLVYIDVRSPTVPVSRERTAATPAPPAATGAPAATLPPAPATP